MADDTTLPGAGELISTDELTTVNDAVAPVGLKVQRVKVGYGPDGSLQDVTPDAPLPVADSHSGNLLARILQMLMAPLGYDKSIGRQRGSVVLESGTVTAVTTVTTVTTLANVAAVGGYTAQMQVFDTNRTAWAQCVRARIT